MKADALFVSQLESIDVHLTTTSAFKRRRQLLTRVRALGVLSLLSFMAAFILDFQVRAGDGVLPFVMSIFFGIAALISLGFVSADDRRGRVSRFVRVIGKSAVEVSRFGAPMKPLSLASAVSGWREGPSKIGLLMKNGDLHELEVGDPDEATAVLQRLSLSAGERALRVPLARQTGVSAGGRAVGFGALLFTTAGIALAGLHDLVQGYELVKLFVVMLFVGGMLTSALWLQRALHALAHGEVVVGLDGVVIKTKGISRFVPMTEIAHAEVAGANVVIERRRREGGPNERIVLAMADTGEPDNARAMALASAITGALARYGKGPSTVGALLERGEKTARAWKADLARSRRAEADYRTIALGLEELGALVVDPSAPPDRRVGAAVALASTSREEARARVRIATAALAGDDLKASLEAAAEGEIDERHLERSMRLHGRHGG